MLKPTEFMLTCPVYVSSLADGLADAKKRAATPWLPAAVAVLAGLTALAQERPLILGGVWLVAVCLARWWVRRPSSRFNAASIVEAFRDWSTAQGHYAAPSATGGLPGRLLMVLYAVAALPVLPVFGYLLARRRLAVQRAVVGASPQWTPEGVDIRCDEALFLYLGYPDRGFAAASGHGGVWFPAESLEERHQHVGRLLAPLYNASGAGLVSGLLLALVSLRLPVWAAWPASLFFLAGAATCLATASLGHRLLRTALMEALVRLAAEQRAQLPTAANEWEDCVQRVTHSTYESDGVRLRDHLFLGWIQPTCTEAWHPFRLSSPGDTPSPMPVLVHKAVVWANCHITGATQTGKSILAVLGMVLQFIRGPQLPLLDSDGRPRRGLDGDPVWQPTEPVPILIIDLKGDLALFNSVKEECGRIGRTFRAFTLEQGCETAYFNPIRELSVVGRAVIEFVELVMAMLSLFHGMSYGRSYYSKQSRDLFLRTVLSARVKPTSWAELYQLLHDELDVAQHKDVFELLSSIFALAQYPALGPAPAGFESIHMPSVIENGEVVYFFLPARASSMSIRDVAKMALYCFMTAAAEWNAKHGERKAVCVIDELQIIASSNMGTVFQQCSGANMSMVLSNQAPLDLNTEDAPHLADTVRTNTRFKLAFTILDPMEAKFWMDVSGDADSLLRSWSESTTVTQGTQGTSTSSGTGVSAQQTVHKRLNQNVINQVNNVQGESLVHVATSAGFTQLAGIPRRIWTPWVMSESEYRRRRATPWPSAARPAPRAVGVPTTVVNTQSPEQVQAAAKQKYAQLEAMFQKLAKRSGNRPPAETGS